MKLPFKVDLKDKVVVVTGAGGIICSHLAKAVAECGAKVCLLDLNKDAADAYASEIVKDGLNIILRKIPFYLIQIMAFFRKVV